MAGGTFGPSPGYTNWEFTGLNTLNQEAMSATIGVNGRIVSITARVGGNTVTVSVVFCLWDSATGNLLAQSSSFTAAIGGAGVGTQTQYTKNLTSSYVALSGATFLIGWYRDPAKSGEWSYTAGSLLYQKTNATGGPVSMAGAGTVAHTTQAQATYTVLNIFVRRSGSWVTLTNDELRRSSAWSVPTPNIRRSGTWTPLNRGLLYNRRERRWYPALFQDTNEVKTLRIAA